MQNLNARVHKTIAIIAAHMGKYDSESTYLTRLREMEPADSVDKSEREQFVVEAWFMLLTLARELGFENEALRASRAHADYHDWQREQFTEMTIPACTVVSLDEIRRTRNE